MMGSYRAFFEMQREPFVADISLNPNSKPILPTTRKEEGVYRSFA